jgi:hypothetical protein
MRLHATSARLLGRVSGGLVVILEERMITGVTYYPPISPTAALSARGATQNVMHKPVSCQKKYQTSLKFSPIKPVSLGEQPGFKKKKKS